MRAFIRYVILPGLGTLLLVLGVLIAAIVWGTSDPPPPMASINEPVARQDVSALPAPAFIRARDGTALAYRAYPGALARAVILVHGSASQAGSMHALARALQAMPDPPSVYALDIRGHGLSGRRGDVDYVGQLEDDLADFLDSQAIAHPAAQWTLIGFSSGGGFALRIAGSALAQRIQHFILLAPYLSHDAPTTRSEAAGWAVPYLPRLVALTLLERAGLPWFQDLPVLAFARHDADGAPYTYSYRLWRSFKAHDDYAADFARAPSPPVVLVGGRDELLAADAFPPLLQQLRSDARVQVLPDLTHMDMLFSAEAQQAVVQALEGE
ncbi:MAG TPA: alpha/beta fold hydrolase [Ferrovibrio sp.]|uniref:alpha/beta hydrolase n=1 Tax=Ferrovibrio sp. TaxID=1917215 RepID=UPI002ED6971F